MTFSFYALLLIALAYPVFLIWCWIGWLRLRKFEFDKSTEQVDVSVSVIVPFRNEGESLKNILSNILEQKYSRYEAIFVNDHSTDNSLQEFNEFKKNNPEAIHIHLLDLSRDGFMPSKKRAITEGIKIAEGELIITADADCIYGNSWITGIATYYQRYAPRLICAPVAIVFSPDNFKEYFLNGIQCLELFGLMVITGGAIENRFPVLSNGANMAYPKKVFEEVKGYEDDQTASGDDTALLKKISKLYPSSIHFLKNNDVKCNALFSSTLKELIQQRRRWASKVPKMAPLAILISLGAVLYNVFLFGTLVYGLMSREFNWFIILLTTKFFTELLVIQSGITFTRNSRKFLWLLLPAQLFYVFYIIIVAVASRFPNYKWKGAVR